MKSVIFYLIDQFNHKIGGAPPGGAEPANLTIPNSREMCLLYIIYLSLPPTPQPSSPLLA
jgi:hypothetical protein